jgi:acyl-CoA synthetase (NDP forming)
MSHYENRLFLHCVVAPDEIRKRYEEAGFPCFEDPTRAVAVMAALMAFGEAFAAKGPGLFALPDAADLPPGAISERAAKEILGNAGLPMVDDVLATSAHYAGEAASRMGGPVAMKIVSPDIQHKTEVGGVMLGVEGVEAVESAFVRIMENAGRHAPDAKIHGVLISPMIAGGVECILGARIDPVFGPVVMFGLGGILTEVLKDVAFRRAPFGPDVAREMIDELKGAAVLKGARGRPPADLDALADAIAKLSLFAAANADTLESVEMNPILALPDRCLALDALIVKGVN